MGKDLYHSICLACDRNGKCRFPGRCFDHSSGVKKPPRDPVDAALYVEDPDFDGVVPGRFDDFDGVRDPEWRNAQEEKVTPRKARNT